MTESTIKKSGVLIFLLSKKVTVKIIFKEKLKSSKNFKKRFSAKSDVGKRIWKMTESILKKSGVLIFLLSKKSTVKIILKKK